MTVTKETGNDVSRVSPDDRALAAAEELAAEGLTVTARAIRERAGVKMTTAAAAARTWSDTLAAEQAIPEMPAVVEQRLEAIWRSAYLAAREQFDEARQGWAQRVAAVEAELEGTVKDLEAAEAGLESATGEVAGLQAGLDAYQDKAEARVRELVVERDAAHTEVAELSRKLSVAEVKLENIVVERDSLGEQADSLVVERNELRTALSHANDAASQNIARVEELAHQLRRGEEEIIELRGRHEQLIAATAAAEARAEAVAVERDRLLVERDAAREVAEEQA